MIAYLQYGAIGIGLAVLGYTAAMLKRELARPKPRPEGRNLILMFMAFSLAAFGIATFIEIKKDNAEKDHQKRLANIGIIVSSLDANLGGKFRTSLNTVPEEYRRILNEFEFQMCRDIRELKQDLFGDERSQCRTGLSG